MSNESPSINPVIAIWKILKAAGVSDDFIDQDNFEQAAAYCEKHVPSCLAHTRKARIVSYELVDSDTDPFAGRDGICSPPVDRIFEQLQRIPSACMQRNERGMWSLYDLPPENNKEPES